MAVAMSGARQDSTTSCGIYFGFRGTEAATAFSLLGSAKNAATFALGWTLSGSEAILELFRSGLASHVRLNVRLPLGW